MFFQPNMSMGGGMPVGATPSRPQGPPGLQVVIMAAGRGTRLPGIIPKVLQKVRGKEMLVHILECVCRLRAENIFVVVNEESYPLIQRVVGQRPHLQYVLQRETNGTGGALQCVFPHLQREMFTLVLNGDMPNVRVEMLGEFIQRAFEEQVETAMVTAHLEDALGDQSARSARTDPASYGRILRKTGERTNSPSFQKIVEAKDATPEELALREVNAGIYFFSNMVLHTYLSKLTRNNLANEYYLTEIFQIIRQHEDNEIYLHLLHPTLNPQILGVNTTEELEYASRTF